MLKSQAQKRLKIGIEAHFAIDIDKKLFSTSLQSENSSVEQGLNTCVDFYDIGFPGCLPKLNKDVIDIANKAAFLLRCDIADHIFWDRKHYNFRDLPLGYQITQSLIPLGQNGKFPISQDKFIRIKRIHIEADAGQTSWTEHGALLNFNRCNNALVEIVSEPDISSLDELQLFLRLLRITMIVNRIGKARMERGELRFDVNVSFEIDEVWRPRVEIKNLNSFTNACLAVNAEFDRQMQLVKNGQEIESCTLHFSIDEQRTIPQRVKESSAQYLFYPELDLFAYPNLFDTLNLAVIDATGSLNMFCHRTQEPVFKVLDQFENDFNVLIDLLNIQNDDILRSVYFLITEKRDFFEQMKLHFSQAHAISVFNVLAEMLKDGYIVKPSLLQALELLTKEYVAVNNTVQFLIQHNIAFDIHSQEVRVKIVTLVKEFAQIKKDKKFIFNGILKQYKEKNMPINPKILMQIIDDLLG